MYVQLDSESAAIARAISIVGLCRRRGELRIWFWRILRNADRIDQVFRLARRLVGRFVISVGMAFGSKVCLYGLDEAHESGAVLDSSVPQS